MLATPLDSHTTLSDPLVSCGGRGRYLPISTPLNTVERGGKWGGSVLFPSQHLAFPSLHCHGSYDRIETPTGVVRILSGVHFSPSKKVYDLF